MNSLSFAASLEANRDPVWSGSAESVDSVFADEFALEGVLSVLEVQTLRACEELVDPDAGESRPWVLAIDDDCEYVESLRHRLEAAGLSLVTASSGLEGFQMAFRHPASAILLDFNMPNGQGDYVLGRLKKNPVTMDIPVIVVTGNRDRTLERRMLNLGAAKFFSKPVEFEDLLTELRRHMPTPPRSADAPIRSDAPALAV